MKRLILLALLLPMLGMGGGQLNMGPGHHRTVASGGTGAATFITSFTPSVCGSTPNSCQITRSTGNIGSAHLIVVSVIQLAGNSTSNVTKAITVTDTANSTYTQSPYGIK